MTTRPAGQPEESIQRELRRLPSIDRLLGSSALAAVRADGHQSAVTLLREAIEAARASVLAGNPAPTPVEILTRTVAAWRLGRLGSLRTVINATGVVLHTNLGRAPLAEDAADAMVRASTAYCSLEYDLEHGSRGSRYQHSRATLRQLTGAEDALVVNNNAAATMLVLAVCSRGREVVVSRGQLVEIGGGFRVPDILAQSGARLVEVGTTNRTYVDDFARAIGPDTAVILRVHPSNFRILGFTHEPALEELALLARERRVTLVDDLGSGSLLDTARFGLAHEPMVQESVAAGADVVCFSGDKLLGGPQTGIIVGRRSIVEEIARNPLTRALRVDKATLAALEATLRHYLAGDAEQGVPVWRMLSLSADDLKRTTLDWAAVLTGLGIPAETEAGQSTVGGGSLPGETLPTSLLMVPPRGRSASALLAQLRRQTPPIIARIIGERIACDPRTVLPAQSDLFLDGIERGYAEQ